MGSSISGILGNHIHGKTRNHRPLLGPNDKPLQEIFLDDIYLQTTNEETADDFHHIINNVHPNLKFEIEKPETTPSGLSLSLLNFKVTISKDGNSSFEFYKKPAKKPLFVHHQSAIPTKIQTQLHSQRTKAHRGQMLLTYICNTTPKHIR